MPVTVVRKPKKAAKTSKAKTLVLGLATDGVKILKQGRSKHFTQKQALDTARKVVAARAGK
jgi:hypothetical protein